MSCLGLFHRLLIVDKWNVSDNQSCDHNFEEFYSELLFALHECSPVSTVKAGKRSNGWINQELCLSHDKLKDLCWRTRESHCPETKAAYYTAKEAHL